MEAQVIHGAHGRARVRLPELRRQPGQLREIASKLERQPNVEKVETNPITGGLVVYHFGPLEVVLQFAREEGLFEAHTPCPVTFLDVMKGLDRRLRRFSAGRTDLLSLSAMVMLGAAVYEGVKGHWWPPAASLVSKALRLMSENEA